MRAENEQGCPDSTEATVIVYPKPTLTLIAPDVCEGDEIVVDCSGVTSVVHDIIEDTEIKGENIDVDINTKYITDALKNIDDENIIVEFSGNAGPVIIKPTEGDSYLYLVLPIRR